MAKKLVLPRVHVMVLCDEIEEASDEEQVHNLLGVRAHITAEHFPYTCELLCVYLQVTGHQGSVPCHVQVVQADTDDVVFASENQQLELEGPLVIRPVTFRLYDCDFPAPGIYYIQAFCNQKLLCERLLLLLEG